MKFIFTADWHIRPDKPICRLDGDWLATQEFHIDFVMKQVIKRRCKLVIGGDLFHKAQVPDILKNMLMSYFTGQHVYGIAGNHDLQFHSFENINSSSYGVLRRSGKLDDPDFAGFAHFGQEIGEIKEGVLFIHEMVFETERDCPPNVKAKTAVEVLEEHPEAKWIFTGDQHHGFHVKYQGRHLINAGCLNRQASNFRDYEPKIWFVDTDANTVEEILVPDDVNMVTDQHIQIKDEREERITAFVSLIRESKSVSLDYEENVKQAIQENPDISPATLLVVEELMG